MTTEDVPREMLEAGRGYEALFVPALFAPWPRHLVEGAAIGAGMDVLDVACGTGALTRHVRAAAGASARVIGADPAPGMLAAAKEVDAEIEWILCSAEDLAVDTASVDSVVSQFGMMFFQDRVAAAGEMLRVLRPGGRLAVAVWNSLNVNTAFAALSDMIETEISEAAADAERMPFCLGDAGAVAGLLEEAGFANVAFDTRTEEARFSSTRVMVEAELRGWLPLFDIHLDEAKIADVLAASDDVLAPYRAASGEAVFPTSAHIFTAQKV